MKIFIRKVLLFLLLIAIVKVATEAIVPYYFPSTYFLQKEKIWTKSEANSIVFGSSRSFRHVDPSILSEDIEDIDFFNFGIPAAINPELYYLFQNFIEELDSGEVKVMALELCMLDTLQRQNLELLRGYHWNNPNILNYSLSYIEESSWPNDLKKSTRNKYLKSFKENVFSLKKIKTILIGTRSYFGFNFHPMNDLGFYTLDKEVLDNKIIQSRRKSFLSDTATLTLQKLDAINADEFANNPFNQAHLDRLLIFKEIADSKGIEFFIVIPPKLSPIEYMELMPIKNSVLADIVIDTHSPSEYSFAYLFDYSFDQAHMNKAGSERYSKQLREEIKRKIKK
ncbi:hypothetical protein [Ekhidna sp.]